MKPHQLAVVRALSNVKPGAGVGEGAPLGLKCAVHRLVAAPNSRAAPMRSRHCFLEPDPNSPPFSIWSVHVKEVVVGREPIKNSRWRGIGVHRDDVLKPSKVDLTANTQALCQSDARRRHRTDGCRAPRSRARGHASPKPSTRRRRPRPTAHPVASARPRRLESWLSAARFTCAGPAPAPG